MADKAYEIVSWPASEEYLKDPGAMTEPGFTYAVGRKGVTTLCHSREQGGSLLGAVVAWDSHQDFKNFIANETGEHTKLRELLAPTRGSPGLSGINKVMVTFTSDPTPALRAPVTEIALATLKPGADSQSISESVGKIVPTTNGSGPSALGAALGFVIDEPERLALVTGWNSIEDHKQAVENGAGSIMQEVYNQIIMEQHYYRFIHVNP